MQAKHLYGLDLLRVVSALAVMVYHFAFRGEAAGDLPEMLIPQVVKSVASYGYLGVSVFFIISGFVIAYSAENQKPIDFLVARFSRIYPTFVIIMSITAAIILLSANPLFQIDIRQFVANLFIFSLVLGQPFVDGVYWSIVLEVVFYGWIFLIIAFGQFRNILKVIPIWLALSLLNETYIESKHLQNLLITEYSGFFSLGIIIHQMREKFSLHGAILFVIAAAYALYTALTGAAWFEEAYSIVLSMFVIAAIVLASVGFFILFIKLKFDARYWPALSILGGATYAFYLVHQNVGYITISGLMAHFPAFGAIAITAAALITLSIAFHVAVERRLNPAVKRFLLAVFARRTATVQQ